jgi:hypothetical protein
MTVFEVFTVIGIIGGLVLGTFNWYNGKRTIDQSAFLGSPINLKTQNEAIQLANDRAFAAEKRADSLEKRLAVLEARLSYKLTFDVILGTNPYLEHVSIEHYPSEKNKDDPSTVADKLSE